MDGIQATRYLEISEEKPNAKILKWRHFNMDE